MLKVTILDRPAEQKFVVEGRLTEPWVRELESAWEQAREKLGRRKCIVDLSDTTAIDANGKRVLAAMCQEGVRFITKGVAMKYLVKDIQRKHARRLPGSGGRTKMEPAGTSPSTAICGAAGALIRPGPVRRG